MNPEGVEGIITTTYQIVSNGDRMGADLSS